MLYIVNYTVKLEKDQAKNTKISKKYQKCAFLAYYTGFCQEQIRKENKLD